jgi:ABC-2 type transport system permease protein
MWQVYLKEINAFLNSLIAYIIIFVFLTTIGLIIWVFPDTSVLEYGYADLGTLFSFGPYVFLFLIPAITMRMFSEEKKSGTLEILFTHPLMDWEIIMGKFLAGFSLVLFTLIPTLLYYYTIYQLGSPVGNIDTAGTTGSYVGLLLLGGVFTSIGIFSSSITENQVVAFIIAVFLCFIIFSGFNSLASVNWWGKGADFIDRLGILYHYNSLSRGLIDSRNLVYFFSVMAIMLLSTTLILGSRKW